VIMWPFMENILGHCWEQHMCVAAN
jgi:hypothetical protein